MMNAGLAQKINYLLVLISLSCLVLMVFLAPTNHGGINDYYRAKFVDLVEGTAYKPFVYRMLLPATVRGLTELVPVSSQEAFSEFIEEHYSTKKIFEILHWETRSAVPYLFATILMALSFMGFGHVLVKLAGHVLRFPESGTIRLLVLVGALAGLPPFFQYISYPYDPPQLLLFTLAVYFLAVGRHRYFFVTFVACCLNKETAILLIPLFAIWSQTHDRPYRKVWTTVIVLSAIYVVIRLALFMLFYNNPGTVVEFQFVHNVELLVSGWSFTNTAVFLLIAALILFEWKQKPVLVRRSFVFVLLPLVALSFFFGYVDEWRGYYEAYPLAFILILHSISRLSAAVVPIQPAA